MGFAFRLGLVYAAFFAAMGVQLPFMPVWFASRGLDEPSIGVLLAVAMVARVATVPFATRAADRFAGPKGAIIVGCLAAAAAMTVLGTMDGTAAIAVTYVVAAAAAGTCLPLIEAYALRGLTDRGRPYGPVRLWGSAAFIAGTLAVGGLLALIPATQIVWVLTALFWFAGLAAIALVPVRSPAPAAGVPSKALGLLRDPVFVAVLAASACIQGSHGLLYGFGSLQWSAAGYSGATIATLWSIGVVAEIILFAASGRLPPAFGPLALMAVGAGGAVLRWTAMAVEPPLAALAALQVLHALSFGACHLGAVHLVARRASPSLGATAQGLLATGNGVAMAGALVVSGPLTAAFGAGGYAAMALMAAAGGFAVLLAQRFNR